MTETTEEMTSNKIPGSTELSQQQNPSTSADYIPMSNPGQNLPGFSFPSAQHMPVCTAPNSYPALGTFGGIMNAPQPMQMTNSPENIQMSQGLHMGSSPQNMNVKQFDWSSDATRTTDPEQCPELTCEHCSIPHSSGYWHKYEQSTVPHSSGFCRTFCDTGKTSYQ